MLSKTVDVELTAREAQLLLDYTFVLDTERKQLQRFANKPGFHTLKTQDFILTGFIADMAHWSKDIDDSALVDELDELCARLNYIYF